MKIGIVSDTHGHAERFKTAYEKFFKDTDLIIHCGDVLYHGPKNPMLADYNPAKLATFINEINIPVVIAKGNCDSEVDTLVLNNPIEAPYAHVFADGYRIVAVHGHTVETDADKDKMAAHVKEDIFITGHIHTNVLERRGATVFVNPGSPALSKREDKRSTVAVADLTAKKITVYDIDNGDALMSIDL